MNKKMFVFQQNNLLAPVGIPDSLLFEGTPSETPLPASSPSFSVPSLAGKPPIKIVDVPPDFSSPLWRALSVRDLISIAPEEAFGRIFRAFHIAQWRRDSAFCGRCGAKNGDDGVELARVCPACGRQEFPRISPAIIVLITDDEDRALLAHNSRFSSGVYSLIAGFNEAGEGLEETVAREVREEVGVEIRDIRYAASQPWPFPHSLMVGFTAKYAGGDISADGAEISDARWFDRDHLPDIPGRGSVARRLIEQWLGGNSRAMA